MSDTLQPVQISRKPQPAAGSREPLSADEARRAIRAAETALLDERRMLTAEELADLAYVPDASVPSLAALAHEVRLAWAGPTVEVEGILSAKTGGCPEDCHFCSQSAEFDTVVKATPFLDTDEVLAAARETAELGASEFCIVLAVRGTDERPAASGDFTARTSGLRFGRTDRTDKLPGAGATKDNCARALGPPAC